MTSTAKDHEHQKTKDNSENILWEAWIKFISCCCCCCLPKSDKAEAKPAEIQPLTPRRGIKSVELPPVDPALVAERMRFFYKLDQLQDLSTITDDKLSSTQEINGEVVVDQAIDIVAPGAYRLSNNE